MKSPASSTHPAINPDEAEKVLAEIAQNCAGARQVLYHCYEKANGSDPATAAALIQAAITLVSVAGWLADSGLRHFTSDPGRFGQAEAWLADGVPKEVFSQRAA